MADQEVLPWLKMLPVAPEYRPTEAEFADPVAYILKIEKEASQYGICKIIPPISKTPKKDVIRNLTENLKLQNNAGKFSTRQQQLGWSPKRPKGGATGGLCSMQYVVQKSVWQSGETYSIEEFEAKARLFAKSRLKSRKDVVPAFVETLFWEAAADRPITVEYGNDIPGTAFRDPDDGFLKDPLKVKPRRRNPEDISDTAWNMRAVSRASGSLLRFMPDEISGVTSPMVYIGMLFSWFAWHVEDHDLHSLNYLHTGAAKTWYAVPGEAAAAFEEVVRCEGYGGQVNPLVALSMLGEKTTVMSPEVLIAAGIPCCRLVQNAGQFVVTFPRAYHLGFSHGFNCGEATNLATPGWLKIAKESAIRRAATKDLPMLSHQQLLYLLAISYSSRIPFSVPPRPRSARLKVKQNGEGEMIVKSRFVKDVIENNHLLSILLGKSSYCSAVLWKSANVSCNFPTSPLFFSTAKHNIHSDIPDSHNPGITTSQSDLFSSEMPATKDASSHVNYSSDISSREFNDFSMSKKPMHYKSKYDIKMQDQSRPTNGFHPESIILKCTACGILGFASMVIIQPSQEAAKTLLPAYIKTEERCSDLQGTFAAKIKRSHDEVQSDRHDDFTITYRRRTEAHTTPKKGTGFSCLKAETDNLKSDFIKNASIDNVCNSSSITSIEKMDAFIGHANPLSTLHSEQLTPANCLKNSSGENDNGRIHTTETSQPSLANNDTGTKCVDPLTNNPKSKNSNSPLSSSNNPVAGQISALDLLAVTYGDSVESDDEMDEDEVEREFSDSGEIRQCENGGICDAGEGFEHISFCFNSKTVEMDKADGKAIKENKSENKYSIQKDNTRQAVNSEEVNKMRHTFNSGETNTDDKILIQVDVPEGGDRSVAENKSEYRYSVGKNNTRQAVNLEGENNVKQPDNSPEMNAEDKVLIQRSMPQVLGVEDQHSREKITLHNSGGRTSSISLRTDVLNVMPDLTTDMDGTYSLNPDNGFLKPCAFCLEHAVEVEEQLQRIGGADLLILCHLDYPMIEEKARSLSNEFCSDYKWKEIPYRQVTLKDTKIILSASDNEERTDICNDWTLQLGMCLRHSVKLSKSPLYNKQLPYNRVLDALFVNNCQNVYASDDECEYKTHRIKHQQRKLVVAGRWCGRVWMVNQVHPYLSCETKQPSLSRILNVLQMENDEQDCSCHVHSEPDYNSIQNQIILFDNHIQPPFKDTLDVQSPSPCRDSEAGIEQKLLTVTTNNKHECDPTQEPEDDDVICKPYANYKHHPLRLKRSDVKRKRQTSENNADNSKKYEVWDLTLRHKNHTDPNSRHPTDSLTRTKDEEFTITCKRGRQHEITHRAEEKPEEKLKENVAAHEHYLKNDMPDQNTSVCNEKCTREASVNNSACIFQDKSCDSLPSMPIDTNDSRVNFEKKTNAEKKILSKDDLERKQGSKQTHQVCTKDGDINGLSKSNKKQNKVTILDKNSTRQRKAKITSHISEHSVTRYTPPQYNSKHCDNLLASQKFNKKHSSMPNPCNQAKKQGTPDKGRRGKKTNSSLLTRNDAIVPEGSVNTILEPTQKSQGPSISHPTKDSFEGGPCTRLRSKLKQKETHIEDFEKQTTEQESSKISVKEKKKSARSKKIRDKNMHYCDMEGCSMSFASKQDLLLHKRNLCTFQGCGKHFFSHKYLMQHRRVHVDDRPLSCPWKGCKMTFKWAWARTEHLRVHTGERPYVCKSAGCGKTFRFVSDYSRHKRKTGHS